MKKTTGKTEAVQSSLTDKTTFREMYENQINFQMDLTRLTQLPVDIPQWFQYHMTSMAEELGEVLKADKRWKTHRNVNYSESEKLDELADVFITAMNLSIFSGFTADEIAEAILTKIQENNGRLNNDTNTRGNK